jgi:hypothetical protein
VLNAIDTLPTARLGPAGGNVRYDAIASISCIDKALQVLIMHP